MAVSEVDRLTRTVDTVLVAGATGRGSSGSFNVTTAHGTVQGIYHKRLRLLQCADGCAYTARKEAGASSPAESGASAPDDK